jgi:hypothetical protein
MREEESEEGRGIENIFKLFLMENAQYWFVLRKTLDGLIKFLHFIK